jgi:transposase
MSISATAKFTNPEWRTVKEIEKSYLKKKYRRIPLKDVEVIGIDEIHLGKAGYRTIVIDLRSGAVLFIGHGRDVEALKPFKRKLASSSCQIKMVAVDMAPSYTKAKYARQSKLIIMKKPKSISIVSALRSVL